MSKSWYALRSHPHKEGFLYDQMLANGIEAYYPRMSVKPVNPRARRIKPYFPGYLFVHVDLSGSGNSIFQWTPHSSGLVSFSGEPSTVPDEIIQALQRRIGDVTAEEKAAKEELAMGEAVFIGEGPFSGYEALFDVYLPGRDRVRVLLKLLSDRAVPLELNASQLMKKRPRYKNR